MKPHPRIRKTIKWGGTAVTVLVVVVWIGSAWRGVCMAWRLGPVAGHSRQMVVRYAGIFGGAVGVNDYSWQGPLPESGVCSGDFQFHWKPLWDSGGGDVIRLTPLWPVAVATLAAASAAWLLDLRALRRARLNLCPKCSYDRAGIAGDAKCPECGSSPPSSV